MDMQAAGQRIAKVASPKVKSTKKIIFTCLRGYRLLMKMPQMARFFAFFYSKKP